MTRFLLDTTFIIDVLNNRRNRDAVMRELIAAQHAEGVQLAIVSSRVPDFCTM